MIFNNAEFKKNIKLEFTTARATIPILILLIFLWISWTSGRGHFNFPFPDFYKNAESATTGMFVFGFIFSIIWGAYLASNSLIGEMQQKTWNFVRMSSLSPSKIMFGKIFGAPAIVWTISLLGILPIIIFTSAYLFPQGGFHRPYELTILSLIASLFFWMLMTYAGVMLIGLYNYSQDAKHTTIGAVILTIVIGLFIGGTIMSQYNNEFSIHRACDYFKPTPENPICTAKNQHTIDGATYSAKEIKLINWYNFTFFPLTATAGIIAFFSCWSLIGLYRTLRRELEYRDSPYIWPIFLVTTAFFLNGFGYDERTISFYLRLVIYGFAASVIIVLTKEAQNMVTYKKIHMNFKSKNYREAYRASPLWLISYGCFIIFAPFLFMSAGNLNPFGYDYITDLSPKDMVNGFQTFFFFYVSMILLSTRDIIMLHLISWRAQHKSPTLGFAIYMFFIYILIPMVLQKISGNSMFIAMSFMPTIQISSNAVQNLNLIPALAIQLAMTLSAILLLKKKMEGNNLLK